LTWTVEFDDAAAKELRKLNRQTQREILLYFRERIATDEDPRRFGKPLSRELAGLWRYRVRNYRMICHIEDDKLIVLVL
jgi:mRNA interferase RelE/StbE